MNLQNSSSNVSSAFERLHPELKRWIWESGWTSLHDAQERAIPAILPADKDVLIGASTAAGKTEAAFLPILSRVIELPASEQLVLQISPLKALINDQYDRLQSICDRFDLPVYPWHGDITSSRKQQFQKTPRGILLITPESLEAMFVNRGTQIPRIFANLQYVVVDELHSFIGEERGRQLQSLLHRLELAIGRFVPRIGLSATLGDMNLAAEFLRADRKVCIIDSPSAGGSLLLSLKAYYEPTVEKPKEGLSEENNPDADDEAGAIDDIARHIYKTTKDSKNLIFPNSRQNVEYYADVLRSLCEGEGRPNAYWPHHGNLSKELRQEVEANLKDPSRPANAVCTSTLEMGVDIGSVKSIAQVGRPSKVSSLRQRLGRSGRRRGESSILRAYSMCKKIKPESSLVEQLHTDLIQMIACIQLLLRGWYEPPSSKQPHLSTLVHQVLSSISQHSSRTAKALWNDLIATGPHKGLDKGEFGALIRELGKHDLIMQDSDGSLILGITGEKFTNSYEFYTVFPLSEEYRIECNGRAIGTITKELLVNPGQKIVFAGRRWTVIEVHQKEGIISVERARGGQVVRFGGSLVSVHDKVRAEMRAVLESNEQYQYADSTALEVLASARNVYRKAGLAEAFLYQTGKDLLVFTWTGDVITQTLGYLLSEMGLQVSNGGFFIEVLSITADEFLKVLEEIEAIVNPESLLDKFEPPETNRWDWALPKDLLKKDFMARSCDMESALELTKKLISNIVQSSDHNDNLNGTRI